MQPPYRVLIVDDEQPARDIIRNYIERIADLICVGECSDASEAMEAVGQLTPHLLILDISMPGMNGLDLISEIGNLAPVVIFVSGYPQFGPQSYDHAALDYLLKPVSFERFAQSIAKFRAQISQLVSNGRLPGGIPIDARGLDHIFHKNISVPRSVWLREEKRITQVSLDEIHYIEGLKDYVKVFFKDQVLLTHMTIGVAEQIFLPPSFVRIHRSHIVRIESIRNIDGNTTVLCNGIELVIGPSYRDRLKTYIPLLR